MKASLSSFHVNVNNPKMRRQNVSTWLEEISRRDLFVNITIQKVPANLLKEFMDKVVNPAYPGGVGAAIKDLMTKAVQEAK
jgi:hypothetical protein